MDVRERLRQVLEGRPEVQLAYLFGSAVRDPARRGRDVDVAIWVEGGRLPSGWIG